jgi:hypothetical protein
MNCLPKKKKKEKKRWLVELLGWKSVQLAAYLNWVRNGRTKNKDSFLII